jgi:hypothetical protein
MGHLDQDGKNLFGQVWSLKFRITRISGPYGPLILALAEGWLNQWRGLRLFPSLPLIVSASNFVFASYMN